MMSDMFASSWTLHMILLAPLTMPPFNLPQFNGATELDDFHVLLEATKICCWSDKWWLEVWIKYIWRGMKDAIVKAYSIDFTALQLEPNNQWRKITGMANYSGLVPRARGGLDASRWVLGPKSLASARLDILRRQTNLRRKKARRASAFKNYDLPWHINIRSFLEKH